MQSIIGTSPERAGILIAKRALGKALKDDVLAGGVELDSKGSFYIQYAPNHGVVTVEINGETIAGVFHLEFGKPCGVIIVHSNDDIGRYDFYPEELRTFSIA